MGDKSSIEWTDATWNPTVGCSIVSSGCTNCYAMKMAARIERMNPGARPYAGLTQPSKAGPVWTGLVRWSRPVVDQPLHWKRPRRIFVNSMSDLFHEDVPDEVIDDIFAIMALAPRHTFQILTKRAERMRDWFAERWQPAPAQRYAIGEGPAIEVPAETEGEDRHDHVLAAASTIGQEHGLIETQIDAHWDDKGNPVALDFAWPLPNVWLGVSAERQQEAEERIPLLLDTPAAVRFVSAEPLLGPLALDQLAYGPGNINALEGYADGTQGRGGARTRIDWVIAGGESGPGARPAHPDWMRGLRDQCLGAGVPFFFKQWGSHQVIYDRDRDDPDWRRADEIARKSPKGQWLNLAGGQGFHGDRVVRVRRLNKTAAGAILDGREHREFPR